MGRMEGLRREQVDELADLLLDMCLHLAGAQYMESILRERGFGDTEMEALGLDVGGGVTKIDA